MFAPDTAACVLQESGIAGLMDFLVPGLGLALEGTRDGRGLQEHSTCFLNNGRSRCTPLMRANIIREHAIVDLCSPSTSSDQLAASKVAQPHLHTVLFSEDIKTAEIYHMNSVTCIVIAGDAGQEARELLMASSVKAHCS